ncbi:GNAT family N-acetyltransferase [Hasllibacter sp. MH4015]|uniref:GNAT family N-acetyltransferase n=1 Tax=Hasllibacter sp. MH4015 TaxID=2854029 RepID=UPI001CD45C7B|nr:GNAT family N-acetyltransferase [Hasllibacter sp. MH4015]
MTELRTDRLILRQVSPDDWPIYERWHGEDRDEAWDEFTGDIGHWAVLGYGWFIVRKSDTPVGNVALHHPPAHGEPELAWNTYDGHRGAGYAPEAARAVLDWAPTVIGDARIVSYIDRNNAASKRVAEKLGARFDGEMATHDPKCEIWVHGGAA